MKSNNNIILRALEPTDLELLYQWENDTEIWSVSNTCAPFSRHVLQQYIENSNQDIYQTRQLRLMIDVTSNEGSCITVGAIDLFDFEPLHLRAGIGVLIADKQQRGKGIAHDALKSLLEYSFHTLMLHQLYCNIAVTNTRSINLFESFGFKKIGIKRDWIKTNQGFEGEIMLQLLIDEVNI